MAKKKKKAAKAKKTARAARPARAAKRAASRERALKQVKPKPRNQRLPGMEDTGIKALDEVGLRYADIRDQRQALTREEVSLKAHALALMHKHNKKSYVRPGLEIHLIPGDENVKVKVTEIDPNAAPVGTGEGEADEVEQEAAAAEEATE